MANGYTPGSLGPTPERKSYSELINEQMSVLAQNTQAALLRSSQKRELENQRLLDAQNTFSGLDISGVYPGDAQALGGFKNAILENMSGGYTNVSQLNADANTFRRDLLDAQSRFSMGQKGVESYTSKSGKTNLDGANYVVSETDLDDLTTFYGSGLFQSVDGAPALNVSGEPGRLQLTGIPLDQNGEVISEAPVSIGGHPIMMETERLFEPPTMAPPAVDDNIRDLVLGGQLNGVFTNVDPTSNKSALYGELGETVFKQNGLLLAYRQEYLRKNPNSIIPKDPKEWTEEMWAAADSGMTEDALLERFREAASSARVSAGVESSTELSSNRAVGKDGKPGFKKAKKMATGVSNNKGESIDGELLRIELIGEGRTETNKEGNQETVYGYRLHFSSEDGQYRAVDVPLDDAAHNAANSVFQNLSISDKSTIMQQAGINPDAEKKNPTVTDPDAEDTDAAAQNPAATTITTTGGGPDVQSITPDEQPTEEQPPADKEEAARQTTLKSEYDDLLKNARSARALDFIGAGKPYSKFVRSIQGMPLSMQRKLIQEKLNYETSNYARGNRPKVLRDMVKKLEAMGVEPVTDEELAETYTSIEKQLSDINYKLSTMDPQSLTVPPSMVVAGLNPVTPNTEYNDLVARREELTGEMKQYENLFGVMTPEPTSTDPITVNAVQPIEGAPVAPLIIQAPTTTDVIQETINEVVDGGTLPEITFNAPRREAVNAATNVALQLLNVDERDNVDAIRTIMDVAVGPEKADSLFRSHREGNIAALKEEGRITDDMTETQVQAALDQAIEEYRGYMGNDTDYDPAPHWCAAFVSYIIKNSTEGLDPNSDEYREVVAALEEFETAFETDDPYDKVRALTFLNVGESINFKDENDNLTLENAKKGDIVVLSRGKGGHVGFFYGNEIDPSTGVEMVLVFGGNQNDAVNISRYPKRRLAGVQRVSASLLPLEEMELISKTMSLVDGSATASAN